MKENVKNWKHKTFHFPVILWLISDDSSAAHALLLSVFMLVFFQLLHAQKQHKWKTVVCNELNGVNVNLWAAVAEISQTCNKQGNKQNLKYAQPLSAGSVWEIIKSKLVWNKY